jgi:hypothetical protein
VSRPALGPTQPPIQWIPGNLFPGLKRGERETDHSLPSSAEVKNVGAIPQLPIRPHGVVLNYLSTGAIIYPLLKNGNNEMQIAERPRC